MLLRDTYVSFYVYLEVAVFSSSTLFFALTLKLCKRLLLLV
jgi:hypothetical protein